MLAFHYASTRPPPTAADPRQFSEPRLSTQSPAARHAHSQACAPHAGKLLTRRQRHRPDWIRASPFDGSWKPLHRKRSCRFMVGLQGSGTTGVPSCHVTPHTVPDAATRRMPSKGNCLCGNGVPGNPQGGQCSQTSSLRPWRENCPPRCPKGFRSFCPQEPKRARCGA